MSDTAAEDARKRGNELFKKQSFAEAIKYYEIAAKLHECSALAAKPWTNCALCHLKLGQHGPAEACATKALEVDRTWGKAWRHRGVARFHLSKFQLAIDDLRQVKKLDLSAQALFQQAQEKLNFVEQSKESEEKSEQKDKDQKLEEVGSTSNYGTVKCRNIVQLHFTSTPEKIQHPCFDIIRNGVRTTEANLPSEAGSKSTAPETQQSLQDGAKESSWQRRNVMRLWEQYNNIPGADRGMVPGDTWYLVDQKWWDAWCSYAGYSRSRKFSAERPSSITNSRIVDACGVLKQQLLEGRDFGLLPEEVWKFLSHSFGGGPAIPRVVVALGGRNSTLYEGGEDSKTRAQPGNSRQLESVDPCTVLIYPNEHDNTAVATSDKPGASGIDSAHDGEEILY